MKDVFTDDLITTMFDTLKKKLPVIFARKEVPKLFGGAIASGILASFGFNAPPHVLSGRHANYENNPFLSWHKPLICTKTTKNSTTCNKK